MTEFYDVCGENILQELDKLTSTKAKSVYTALARHSDFKLIEIKAENLPSNKVEHFIVDVSADVIQYPKQDINYTERLCVSFYDNDVFQIDIKALRKTFPRIIHTNLTPVGKPISLCIYNEDYQTVQLTWTAMGFLNRISDWLAKTSRDCLHFEDQPLEPLLINPRYKVVIPEQLFDNQNSQLVVAEKVFDNGNSGTLILNSIEIDKVREIRENLSKQKIPLFYVLQLKGHPQAHGVIHDIPNTLNDLQKFLAAAQIDLIAELRTKIRETYETQKNGLNKNDSILVLLDLPKLRDKIDDSPEVSDYWVFWIGEVKSIGLDLDVLIDSPSQGAVLNVFSQKEKNGENTKVQLLQPILDITPQTSAGFNSIEPFELKRNFAMIGVGALGSQILQHFIRMGFGQWTIIDNDDFLPHNVARHVLNRNMIGCNKANAVEWTFNNIFDVDNVKSIPASFFTLDADQLERITKADAIVDVSTSLPVARKLALDTESNARKLTVFVTPSGNDSVLLCEDENKNIKLDALEAQYYRAILNKSTLSNHLNGNQGGIRYGGGCREISNKIPQDSIALHASILSKQIRKSLSKNNAQISIWRANDDGSVDFVDIPTEKTIIVNESDWDIVYDESFVKKVSDIRAKKLPNETGGVLVGFFDTQRKRIYIVDTLESPKDSIETPWSYVRGREGLADKITSIKNFTAHIVNFIADWHSHPDYASVQPSHDDSLLLDHHTYLMRNDGLPGVILIVGDKLQLNWIIKE